MYICMQQYAESNMQEYAYIGNMQKYANMCNNMQQNIQTCSTKYVGNMNKYASKTEKTAIYIYI